MTNLKRVGTISGVQATLNTGAVELAMAHAGIDSISQLARDAGLARSHLSNLLAQRRAVQASQVVALAKALHVAPVTLLAPVDPRTAIIELAIAAGVTADELGVA